MKRSQLIKEIEKAGCVLKRHGKRHDLYVNPANGMQQPIPRHSEIDNILAAHIKKYLGIP
ncbi:MAG: type II toxin-antitoxin system HicA family toxin [Spirochaetota bacterium]